MKHKQWQHLETIFHTALSLDGEQRVLYLSEACSGDAMLLSEVDSLISAFEQESEFLEKPAFSLGINVLRETLEEKSLTGTKIGCYEIREKLGAGGMGDVYLAEDTRLNRKVALKFLKNTLVDDKWAKRQLVREAQAVAMLEHPNICAVHSIEETDEHSFIVMQYVEGETLAKFIGARSLGVEELLSIARQIINAVAVAHSHGIIHRDIKPGNIMITPEGHVKVLDFGLAKVVQQKQKAEREEDNISQISRSGLIVGTVSYMSPEQLRTEKLDYRSDIFSVGIVLCELFYKQNPFSRKSQAETIAAIVGNEAVMPDKTASGIPDALRAVVEKCLNKDKEKRFQSAAELLVELDNFKNGVSVSSKPRGFAGIFRYAALFLLFLLVSGSIYYFYPRPNDKSPAAASPTVKIPVLAVLPIINETNQPDKDSLGDGLTVSLIDKLSRLSNLEVKPDSFDLRSEIFKDLQDKKPINPQNIGQRLGVDTVLVGKIVARENILVLQTSLVNVSNGATFSNPEYVIDETRLSDVQENISAQIISKLNTFLSEEDRRRVAKRQTDSPEAFNHYFKGRYFWNRRDKPGNMDLAIEYFNKATESDASFALAWAGLADSYALNNTTSFKSAMTSADAAMLAKAAAKNAIELDDGLSEPHTSLGIIKSRYEWDWKGAENDFKRSVELNPQYAPAYHWYARLLSLTGRYEEALAFARKARALEPFSVSSELNSAHIYFYMRNYEQAANIYKKVLKEKPDNRTVRNNIGWLYLQTGKTQEAINIFEKIYQKEPLYGAAGLGYAYAKAGRTADAFRILDEIERLAKKQFVSSQEKAIVYIGLGDKDKAFENLNRACDERYAALPNLLAHDPLTDSLRSDPRFETLILCANLSSFPKRFVPAD